MKSELILTTDPIDEAALAGSRKKDSSQGAIVAFSGVVRDNEDGGKIEAIFYEAFEAMVRHQFQKIFEEAGARHPSASSVRLVHRIGKVMAGEASLWVEVTSPHRREAFEACLWIIEEMKRVVPIWKRPIWTDDSARTTPDNASAPCQANTPGE